ncbi:MAG: hypothetical protein WEE89_06830 [Gemmatimonadota bacterium]
MLAPIKCQLIDAKEQVNRARLPPCAVIGNATRTVKHPGEPCARYPAFLAAVATLLGCSDPVEPGQSSLKPAFDVDGKNVSGHAVKSGSP